MSRGVSLIRLIFIGALAVVALQSTAETKLNAADLVPAELLKNPTYAIDAEVSNDGFMNTYLLRSKYGNFQAESDSMLGTRAREVDALERLANSSKTGVVVGAAVDSLVDAGKSPFILAGNIASRPVDTVTGIPGGVARTFGRYMRTATGVAKSAGKSAGDGDRDTASQAVGFAEGWFGITSAERKWAKDLQIDPYTTNEVMAAALKGIARYDAAGNFATSLAVPGLGAVKTVATVTDLVWEMHPADLKRLNRKRLAELGVTEETIEAFDNAPWVSPTVQTVITAAALELAGVENLDSLIGLVPQVNSEVAAVFLMQSIEGIVWYHKTRKPVARIVSGPTVPVFVDRDGRIVATLALDYLAWTADAGKAWQIVLDASGDDNAIIIKGRVEPAARAELEKRGWSMHDRQSFAVPAAG